MADPDRHVLPHQANHLPANTSPRPALHQFRSRGQRNPHVVVDDQQGIHREIVPQPVVMQGEMHYPRNIDAPNYNAAHYHPPLPHHPYVHIHQDVGPAEAGPAQAHRLAPDFENHDGVYTPGAQFPAVGLPEAFPGVWPHPAPPADIPPANGLRILAARFLNNPDTLVNMLRIEPGHGGRFEVWIGLELADLF